ncbi:hypothetical protein [Weissella confusa]|uniref:hypothetical protein n=1 Tax=Weissella confusa TaxID=1583 RepID=UPI0018F1F390|nr:hypothetical protein [Weissella confusa]MBJ7625082.1 hypothetical protein [Weissella confusa]MBJ7650111.1 hypothetical protein [Weissella confusa]MBJ7662032.1 hypothetical protein [Weissella confusa]MBJ7676513.1 hypothetical protein [Weissella confusa]
MAKVIDVFAVRDLTLIALDEDLPMDTKIGQAVRLNGKIVHVKSVPMFDPKQVYNALVLGVKAEIGDEIIFEVDENI